jgi:hypothetical protein
LAALTCAGVSPSGAAGGNLSGSYPNPVIAPGVVTTANFASGAQAPDSAQLGSLPPTDYGAVLSGRINGLTTTGSSTDFGAASGTSTANGTEANVYTLSPAENLVARDLSVQLTSAPGSGAARNFLLSVNGSPQDANSRHLACIIVGTNATCSNPGPMSVPAGSTLSLVDENIEGTATAASA